jgi:hypothetical protein
MANEITLVNGVTKYELQGSGNYKYLFPLAQIVAYPNIDPNEGYYDLFIEGNNTLKIKFGDITDKLGTADILEYVDKLAENTVYFGAGLSASVLPATSNTGWASYVDTQYTNSGSPFVLAANTDTILPNNAGTIIDSQKPNDIVTFYDGSVITGRNGDNLDIMIYFKAVPSSVNQYLDIWIDIGGAIGELYRQTFEFPKGAGVERGVLYSLPSAYTLNTWEANGGTVYLRSNSDLDIFGINYNFDRSHKAV